MKIFKIIIFLFFVSTAVKSQHNNYAVGGGIGFGSFTGNFPTQTTFGSNIFFETSSSLEPFESFRFHFIYAQKIEKFLPGNTKYTHYSYMTSFGISGIIRQPINEFLFVEEGLGIIYLNDRSFDDINTWNYGLIFNLLSGVKVSKVFELSININYGLTFNNTNPGFVLFLVQGKYLF